MGRHRAAKQVPLNSLYPFVAQRLKLTLCLHPFCCCSDAQRTRHLDDCAHERAAA